MDAAQRFLVQRPPRSGWPLFGLALAAVLMPAALVLNSRQPFSAAPAVFAGAAGLVLGVAGNRWTRAIAVVAALLVPPLILELAPSPGAVVSDLGVLLSLGGPRPPLAVPAQVAQHVANTWRTLQAAWLGDENALNWAIERLCALLAYAAALLLGSGLRRGTQPHGYALPLLMTIAVTGIMVRANSLTTLAATAPALLVCVNAGFAARERSWERTGVDYSGLLRSDVTQYGALLLGAAIVLALLTPAVPGNPLTRRIWAGVQLPAGLARLDRAPDGPANNAAALRLGDFVPGQSLELGRSIEQGSAEQLALLVRAPGIAVADLPYWRGRILDQYTGSSWTTGPIRNIVVSPPASAMLPDGVVVQEISAQRAGAGLRYGLADIVALDTGGTYEQDASGTTTAWLGNQQRYTVYSRPPQPLDFSGPEAIETQRILTSFMQLPDDLPPRVGELARRLTAGAVSQTARAEALERYLRALPYSYEVAPLPPNVDAVDQFLFEMRSGYCTYYASAMAIMARAAGIPSRVAVGYASGAYDPATRQFVVREADAHAWPELYIDGQGWTRWEPTPVRPVPARSAAIEQPRPSIQAPQPDALTDFGVSWWWAIIVPAAVLMLLLAVYSLRRLLVPLTPARVHADLYRWGRRAGVQPRVADSIEEYAARLARAVPVVGQPLQQVARLLTARGYRLRPLDSDEEHELVDTWNRARSLLRRRKQN